MDEPMTEHCLDKRDTAGARARPASARSPSSLVRITSAILALCAACGPRPLWLAAADERQLRAELTADPTPAELAWLRRAIPLGDDSPAVRANWTAEALPDARTDVAASPLQVAGRWFAALSTAAFPDPARWALEPASVQRIDAQTIVAVQQLWEDVPISGGGAVAIVRGGQLVGLTYTLYRNAPRGGWTVAASSAESAAKEAYLRLFPASTNVTASVRRRVVLPLSAPAATLTPAYEVDVYGDGDSGGPFVVWIDASSGEVIAHRNRWRS